MPPEDNHNEPNFAAALSIEVRDQDGVARRLEDFRGHNVVLYFYPADDTPGCTVEGKEFRELHDQFKAVDAVVIGVSTDSAERHKRFAEKHGFPFILLADTEGTLAGSLSVLRSGRAA
ncbi:MAG: peroxiredoxin, partial [Candidatus Binataceae bacterium]